MARDKPVGPSEVRTRGIVLPSLTTPIWTTGTCLDLNYATRETHERTPIKYSLTSRCNQPSLTDFYAMVFKFHFLCIFPQRGVYEVTASITVFLKCSLATRLGAERPYRSPLQCDTNIFELRPLLGVVTSIWKPKLRTCVHL